MGKVWTYQEASARAGEMYGNLLARNSDPAGFQHVVGVLVTGESSIRDVVRECCRSEEFREKHVMNQSPNELARRILIQLGKQRPAPERVKQMAVDLLERDW